MGKVTPQKQFDEIAASFLEEMKTMGVTMSESNVLYFKSILWFKLMSAYYIGQQVGLDNARLIVRGGK